jgi:hypothetical protein
MRACSVFLVGLAAACVALVPRVSVASPMAGDELIGEALQEFLPKTIPLVLNLLGKGTACYKSAEKMSQQLLEEAVHMDGELLKDDTKLKKITASLCALEINCVKKLGKATKDVMRMPEIQTVMEDMFTPQQFHGFDAGVDQAVQLFEPMCDQFRSEL